ncbi:gamma-soluble NSF attachment protein-like [Tubulanus polymorphus]|uniref:gamma-soluble NSF attachment protein-like n=1 Tax=Tubulanus polymorphus TaxID=672921 RepID=UPI003DA4D240
MAEKRHLQEGEDHLKAVEKCLKTSLMKWKPDYDGAASEYAKAAISFKNAKALERCRDAYIKAADMQLKLGGNFHAAKSLEAAGLVSRDMKDYQSVANLMGRAGQLFRENGTTDTAALTWEKAAKILELPMPEASLDLYRHACECAEVEDRPRQAADSVGRSVRLLIRLQRYDEAADMIKKEIDLHALSENFPTVVKLVTGAVLIHLSRTDYVAANKMYKAALGYPEFIGSDDARALEALLDAYDSGDGAVMNETLSLPVFKYMENDFAKLARALKAPGASIKSDRRSDKELGADEEDDDEYSGGLC